jgi:hypothetical protein
MVFRLSVLRTLSKFLLRYCDSDILRYTLPHNFSFHTPLIISRFALSEEKRRGSNRFLPIFYDFRHIGSLLQSFNICSLYRSIIRTSLWPPYCEMTMKPLLIYCVGHCKRRQVFQAAEKNSNVVGFSSACFNA